MILSEFINQYNTLTEYEKKLLDQETEHTRYKSKEFFIKSGERSNQVGLIISGVFRYFFFDTQGNEITAHFMAENEFVGNATSFFEFSPSSGSIQAETDCEIILIKRESWDLFSKEIPQWDNTIQKYLNEVLIKKTGFQRSLINIDSKSAYLKFINSYPSIAQRAPLNHIASYLGMTPFSLSRIRKAIASL